MKWFEYATGRDADGIPTHFDILKNARRRRVFTTENPNLIRKCLTLKGAGLMAGDEQGFRLTGQGHKLLKETPVEV